MNVQTRSRFTLEVGDRVRLTRNTAMHDKGALGVVTNKYTPAHCTGVWDVTVLFDGRGFSSKFNYPDGSLERIN
jgi:hypothetical protein